MLNNSSRSCCTSNCGILNQTRAMNRLYYIFIVLRFKYRKLSLTMYIRILMREGNTELTNIGGRNYLISSSVSLIRLDASSISLLYRLNCSSHFYSFLGRATLSTPQASQTLFILFHSAD